MQEEIKKFSHSNWWNFDSIESKMLHRLNILRMRFITSLCNIKGLEILDAGCGGGIASESLARCGANVTGIDASAQAIECAKNHAKEGGLKINYVNTTVENFETKKQFDIIFANDIIEHVESIEVFLQHISQFVKKDGLLVISTINKNLLSLVFAKFAAEYVFKMVPKGTHEYQKFVKPKELQNHLEQQFTHIKTQGFSYNVFTKEFFFEPTALVNYFLVAQKDEH